MCKVCRIQRRREYTRKYPERVRDTALKGKYGITLEEYDAMYARQEGRCAICGVAKPPKKLFVDHNHKTNKVRALLCHHCNTMIGSAREDIAILVNAAAYLYAEQRPELGPVRASVNFMARDEAVWPACSFRGLRLKRG